MTHHFASHPVRTARHARTARWCVAALVVATALGACKKGGNASDSAAGAVDTTHSIAPAPAAFRVADVELGRHLGANKRVTDKADSFGVRDTIYASVLTEGTAPTAKLIARWTFNGGKQVVKQDTLSITPTGGNDATEFHLQKKSAWPKGKYQVQILLDSSVVSTKDFEVK